MKITLKNLLLLLFLFFGLFWGNSTAFSQNKIIDSLLLVLKKDKLQDTNHVNHLNQLAWEMNSINPDSTILLGTQALHLSEKIILPGALMAWQKGIGNSYNKIGWGYYKKGEFTTSMEFFNKAMEIWNVLKVEAVKDPTILNLRTTTISNMGSVCIQQGNYPKALGYAFEAMKTYEKTRDKSGLATAYGCLGIIYDADGDLTKSLDYYNRALKINEELKDQSGIATNLGNIGIIFDRQKKYPEALDCFFKAEKIAEEQGNKVAQANNLGSIGSAYYQNEQFDKAIDYYQRAVKLDKEINNKNDLSITLGNLGSLYTEQAKTFTSPSKKQEGFKNSEKYLYEALAMSDSIGDIYGGMEVNRNLSDLYTLLGNDKKALERYKLSMIAKDTLFNQDKNQEITKKEMNYDFDKKEEAVKAEHEKEMAVADSEKKRQRLFLIFVCVIALAVGIIAILVSRSLRTTRKQKNIIEEQKKTVEEKQKEILDSIHYAKRIQQSLLSTEKYIDKTLKRLQK